MTELKDFRYYADKAEEQISTAEKYVEQIYNPRLRETALTAAAIYARLAAAAPKMVRPAVYRDGNMRAAGKPMRDDS